MNKRQFLKGMAATAAGILVPSHVLSGQYEFHQRVSGLRVNPSSQEDQAADLAFLATDLDLKGMRFAVADNASIGASAFIKMRVKPCTFSAGMNSAGGDSLLLIRS